MNASVDLMQTNADIPLLAMRAFAALLLPVAGPAAGANGTARWLEALLLLVEAEVEEIPNPPLFS